MGWECGAFYGLIVHGSFFVFPLFSVTDGTEKDDEEQEDGTNKGSTNGDDFVACCRVGDCFSDS